MEEPKLEDYALIGNSCSSALVSRHGSIDWCCLPEFHSPAVFAALLDREKGGHFSITPVGAYESSQRYMDDTNVAVTRFITSTGTCTIKDAFTAIPKEQRMDSLAPGHEILRIVEGIGGTVRLRLEYRPRIFYGKTVPTLLNKRYLGIQFASNENIIVLLTTLDPGMIELRDHATCAVAEFEVNGDDKIIFSLSYSDQSPAVIPELRTTASGRLQKTMDYWKTWIRQCRYEGLYLEQVKRSALTLKLLAHAPSGSIVAAPTTSLPEAIGGERNWDYRYCWLRDASFTTRVLVNLGFHEEAHAYMNWILHATQLTRPELHVVYSVYGHSDLRERTLDWLQGYRNSRPVRIGNKADAQFQLDVYGEVLDAVYAYAPLVRKFDRNSKKFIIGLGEVICRMWRKPDRGIWELRSEDAHHTHSKVMAWTGLDRLVKLCQSYGWTEAPLRKFEDTAAAIRSEVEQSGYNAQLRSYTRQLHGNDTDASLLTLSLVGYCAYDSPAMMSTVDMIIARLSNGNLLYRYRNVDDGLAGVEGSFAICNFWLAENLARSGKIDHAVRVFESTVGHASPAGLLAEQIDPRTHHLSGNYPQGFTHIGLINAAISINEAMQNKGGHERT